MLRITCRAREVLDIVVSRFVPRHKWCPLYLFAIGKFDGPLTIDRQRVYHITGDTVCVWCSFCCFIFKYQEYRPSGGKVQLDLCLPVFHLPCLSDGCLSRLWVPHLGHSTSSFYGKCRGKTTIFGVGNEVNVGTIVTTVNPLNTFYISRQRRILTLEIIDEATSLQESLTTGEIRKQRFCTICPPCLSWCPPCTPHTEGHARFGIHPRIVGCCMKHQLVNAKTESRIGDGFQTGRIILPGMKRPTGKPLCINGLMSNSPCCIHYTRNILPAPVGWLCPKFCTDRVVCG